ncbi:MAG: hypothetical protein K6G65_08735 [Lachnospiraceae bacterium]|nr:hypothetical protein [Lachnospiraceae bacterium]
MAKKNKDKIEDIGNEEKFGSKLMTFLIAMAIVIIWLFVFGLLIKMDVGGFGSNVLTPILKDVPVLNKVLPGNADIVDSEGNTYTSLGQAIDKINELELMMSSSSNSATANTDYIAQLEAEVARLKVFEQNQAEFAKQKEEFDNEVVFTKNAPDIEEYKKYYEEIDPTNAEAIYQKVVEQLESRANIKEQAQRYAAMDPANAAQILEVMTGDLDLVCQILKNMKPEESAAIIAEMSAEYAAQVTKKMSLIN